MSYQSAITHQKKVAKSTELFLFSDIVPRISIACLFIISSIFYCLLALNLFICVVGGTLANYTRTTVMFTTERSRDFGKWCITLGQGILALAMMDISEKSLLSSSVLSTPPKCKTSKRTVRIPVMSKPTTTNHQKSFSKLQLSSEPPPLSMIGEISLNQCKKSPSCKDTRYRPTIPSSLGPNRPNDREKLASTCPSQRFSTSAFSRPKRSLSIKLIDSTAANRVTIYQRSRVAAVSKLSHSIYDNKSKVVIDAPPVEDECALMKKSKFNRNHKETVIKDNNMKLDENRPMVYQQRRRIQNKKSPSMTLHTARRYLKIMLNAKSHRYTI
ncbi:16157_t:CDS:2 [Acaulospora morrowiae]|uniref:16157_t:CDS:1 n=1 Tax=Acaulospora morrowiae TaxID=94023 RepID=A0A9N9AWS3_9GLOM|nr:16157_t:CDS:2 [Acaulospora morrowiae]